jgi:hypothetical protein
MSSLTAWSQCDGDGRCVKLPQTPVFFYSCPKFKFLKRLGHLKFLVEGLISFCMLFNFLGCLDKEKNICEVSACFFENSY